MRKSLAALADLAPVTFGADRMAIGSLIQIIVGPTSDDYFAGCPATKPPLRLLSQRHEGGLPLDAPMIYERLITEQKQLVTSYYRTLRPCVISIQ